MHINNRNYLLTPLSSGRVKVDDDGEIYCDNVQLNKVVFENGRSYVEIDWYDGKKWYDAGLVVMVANDVLRFEPIQWEHIESCYRDKDPLNTSLSNLFYRFKNGPLPVPGLPGYFYIPHAARYAINREGDVYSLLVQSKKTWLISKGDPIKNKRAGYHYQAVVPDWCGPTTIYKHRAWMMTFDHFGDDLFERVVNHKDGDKFNNEPSNFEWSTYAENNKHARMTGLTMIRTRKIAVKNYFTDTIKIYDSIVEAANDNPPLDPKRIGYRLEVPPKRMPSYGIWVKDIDDKTPWPEWKPGQPLRLQPTQWRFIVGQNLDTRERRVFASIRHAARETHISEPTVKRYCSEKIIPKRGGWTFRYAEDKYTLPDVTD